jgi:hypothetical protein
MTPPLHALVVRSAPVGQPFLRFRSSLAAACLAACGACVPAAFASGAASSASLAGSSASVGSISGSLESSSTSSTGGERQASGPYRVEQVAAAADRPGHVRVALIPEPSNTRGQAFALVLPQATAEAARLERGDTVVVAERSYGLAKQAPSSWP